MKLSLQPQKINKSLWYYEERKGLWFVREVFNERKEWLRTEQFLLPKKGFRLVKKSLKKYFDQAKKEAKKKEKK